MIQSITRFFNLWRSTTPVVAAQSLHHYAQQSQNPDADIVAAFSLRKSSALTLVLLLLLVLPLQVKAGSWTSVGPNGGSVSSFSISPDYATDQTLFAGTRYGGVFKSTDGGGSWSAVNTGLSYRDDVSFSISPDYSTDQTLFAGTWGGGVFKSTNGGGSWSAVNTGLSNLTVGSLAISPDYATDQTIFAGIYYTGIVKSTNGGGSWSEVNTGMSNPFVNSLSISPDYATDQTIFAGDRGGSGIFKSTNGGESWSQVNTGLGNLIVLSLSISPNYSYDGILFAGTAGSSVWKYSEVALSGFESGTTPWVFFTDGAGTFLTDAPGDGSPNAGHVTIQTPGTNVQMYQTGLELEANTRYRLSFKAYSNTGHDVSVSLQKNVSPYTGYGLSGRVFNLTTVWQAFTVEFTTTGFAGTVNDGRLMFWLAPYDASGDHYYFDDVVLEKIGTP